MLNGFWSIEDSQDLIPAAAEAVRRSRERHGRAITLVDMSGGSVASAALVNAFTTSRPVFMRSEDKVAMVFTSALLQGQMKRVKSVDLEAGYFGTVAEAEAWLRG